MAYAAVEWNKIAALHFASGDEARIAELESRPSTASRVLRSGER
jgi:hypothetical protein